MAAASFAALGCADSVRPGDRDAVVDAAAADRFEDDLGPAVADGGTDGNPECPALTPLRLSDPRIVTGNLAPGQKATLAITLTNTGDVDYRRYPGASLASSTPGVTFGAKLAILPLLAAKQARPLQWTVTVAPAVATGTVVPFSATVVGGGALDCPNAHTLSFSLTVE
jgi:hypothetical protein